MRFGCYGVRSGHTESFIAGDRERPTTSALSIESHSQLYVKMRIILIKFIWHLRCFYHLAPDLQASSLY